MSNGLNAPQRARYSDHSLAAYLAPLVQARRVGVVGPTSGDLARRFRALGAATTVSFGGAGEGIAVRALTPGAIAQFHGKLDCIVVPDAAAVPLDAVLDESRRALGQDGILVVGSQPPGAPRGLEDAAAGGARAPGPDYYDLLDALGARFAAVQMLGRGAFVGYTIASLTEPAGELSLDTRLMPDDPVPAEAFIAVASDNGVALEAQALVQVPVAEVLAAPAPQPVAQPAPVDTSAFEKKISGLEQQVAQRDTKVKELETASAERWVKIQRLEHELKGLDEEARKARDRAAKLTKDLDDERKLRQRIELDAQMSRRAPELPRGADPEELARVKARVTQLEHELTAAHAEVTALKARVADLDRELDEAQATEAELRKGLDASERAVASARKAPAREKAPAPPPPPPPARPAVDLDALRAELDATRASLEQVRADLARARDAVAVEREASGGEYVRLEQELRARAEELITARQQLADRDAAVRELAYSFAVASQGDAAREAQEARERAAELAALNASLASEASGIVEQNELLRERIGQLEADVVARANEAQEASFRASELAAKLAAAQAAPPAPPSPPSVAAGAAGAAGDEDDAPTRQSGPSGDLAAELDAVRAELAAVRVAASIAQQAERDHAARAHEAQSLLEEVRRALEEERTRSADARARLEEARARRAEQHDEPAGSGGADREQLASIAREREEARRERDEARARAEEERTRASEIAAQLSEARNDLARQYAVIASIEDRVVQTRQELDGARAGYTRRVRELEREIDQLVQALEVAGTHSTDEADSLGRVLREVEVLQAERRGLAMRLSDAEASLSAQSERVTATATTTPAATADAPTERGEDIRGLASAAARADELLADLSETAARLASTEQELSASREATAMAEQRVAELSRAVESLRSELAAAARPASDVTPEQLESLRRESAERELLVRSLVAQLEDRDLRLRAMERRLVEDVERARRTESEIWEVELRARDQRIMALSREVERARSSTRTEGTPAQGQSVPAEINGGEAHEVGALRAALEGRERELGALRAALEQVRTGLSSILVDGRGAVVAHDLVSILRQIEEPQPQG